MRRTLDGWLDPEIDRIKGKINSIKRDIHSTEAEIRQIERDIKRGFRQKEVCENKTVYVEQKGKDGPKIQKKLEKHCHMEVTDVNVAFEEERINDYKERISNYESELPSHEEKLRPLEEQRQEAYDRCRTKIMKMSPEEAFQLYQ